LKKICQKFAIGNGRTKAMNPPASFHDARYQQASQPEKAGTVSEKVAESSRQMEQAARSSPPAEKAANGIAQAAKEIT
jgi:hypothetical protein